MVYDPFSAASDINKPECECEPPLVEGAVMCKGGQFAMIKDIIQARSASDQPQSPVCSLQAVTVHPLCPMQTSHYTPESSPPSSRGANLPQQSPLAPPQMGTCFESVIINSWVSQYVTWMIQNELTMSMHHICCDLLGVERQTDDTRFKNCFRLPLSLSLV